MHCSTGRGVSHGVWGSRAADSTVEKRYEVWEVFVRSVFVLVSNGIRVFRYHIVF